MRSSLAALALALVAACGATSEPPTPTSSSEAAKATPPPRAPKKHVEAASHACSSTRGAGNATAARQGCSSDAECTAGGSGRCQVTGLGIAECTYDACVVDTDCTGNTFCDCRPAEGDLQANRCVHGDCRSDADCGGPYCSPSNVPDGLGGTGLHFQGYFCHSARDACIDDAECPDGGCDYDVDQKRFRCSVRTGVAD